MSIHARMLLLLVIFTCYQHHQLVAQIFYFIGFRLFCLETVLSLWVIQQVYMYFRSSGITAERKLPWDPCESNIISAFDNFSVAPLAQAAFPYIFVVSKFLQLQLELQKYNVQIPSLSDYLDNFMTICLFFVFQSGAYDLVGTIAYEIDQNPYQSTFYNGTIQVTEVGDMLIVQSVLLFCLVVALRGLFLGFGYKVKSRISLR